MPRMSDVHVLIVAGGRGLRLGAPMPKQYADLAGKPLLARTVLAFLDLPRLGRLQLVIGAGQDEACATALSSLPGDSASALMAPVPGGAERQDSVRAGLDALKPHVAEGDIILVHDAARPFIPNAMVNRVVAALDGGAVAVVPSLPVVDSLKRLGDDGRVLDSVPRDGLARVQTPQGFRFGALYKAHQAAIGQAFSDDAGVMQAAGHAVTTVPGAEEAFKVTDEADLARARAMAEARTWPDIRTGTGFDVHRLGPGDGVTLCGVFIPWDRQLIGHSDADVGWHALTDALLGAVAAGDIGSHFPPSEARWKGANSAIFLAEAARIARLGGGRIVNVDVTLICERPKVGPHREVMRQRTADILGLEIDRVSIKATTTEQLGFTGRGEGIAAQAIASVAR